jgi:hypothetical protein
MQRTCNSSFKETRINQQKKDIKEIKQLFITQHHHIKNMPDRYDVSLLRSQTKNLVYLIKPMSHGPKNIDDIKKQY